MFSNQNLFRQVLIICVLFFATIFSCKKSESRRNVHNTNIQTVIDRAKQYNQSNAIKNLQANQLDWNSILIGITLSGQEPYTLTVPVVGEGKHVEAYSTIYIDSNGYVVKQLFFNQQSLSNTKNDDIKIDISSKFNQIKSKGYVVSPQLLIPLEHRLSDIKKIKKNIYVDSANFKNVLPASVNKTSGNISVQNRISNSKLATSSDSNSASCMVNFQMTYYFWHQSCPDYEIWDIQYTFSEFLERTLRDYAREQGNTVATVRLSVNSGIQVSGLKSDYMSQLGFAESTQDLMTSICASYQFPNNCSLGSQMMCNVYNFGRQCAAPPTTNPGDGNFPLVEIKEDSLLKHYPCMVKEVINKLLQNQSFGKLVQPFQSVVLPNGTTLQTAGLPDLTFDFSQQPYGNNSTNSYSLGQTGRTAPRFTGVNSRIEFNSLAITNASQLFLQAATIHETAHAYANYYIKAGSYGVPVDTTRYSTWAINVVDFASVAEGQRQSGNFSDHSIFLETYFDKFWTILKDVNGSSYTDKQYQMAALYGLNNPGDMPTNPTIAGVNVYNIYKDILIKSYNNIMSKYSITATELNNFNLDNLTNVPASKKLPTNCP